jgi:hypothetical protein
MKNLFVPYDIAVIAKEKGLKLESAFETYTLKRRDAKRLDDFEVNVPTHQQLTDFLNSKGFPITYGNKPIEEFEKEAIKCLQSIK